METVAEGVTVGELVAGDPRRAKVFDRHGIDFCCHGSEPFRSACDGAGPIPTHCSPSSVSRGLGSGRAARRGVHAAGDPRPPRPRHAHECSTASSHSSTPWRSRSANVHGGRHPELARVAESGGCPARRPRAPPRQGGAAVLPAVDQIVRAERSGGDTGRSWRTVGDLTESCGPSTRWRGASSTSCAPRPADSPSPTYACASYTLLTKAWPPSTPTPASMCTPRTTALPAPWRGAARVGAS